MPSGRREKRACDPNVALSRSREATGLAAVARRMLPAKEPLMPKRQLMEPAKGDKRYVRRSAGGRFTAEQENVGRSLTQDRRRRAKSTSTPGYGDKGDRRRRHGPRRATRSRSR